MKALHRENQGLTALHTDRDFFWWIPGKEECAVPLHKRLMYLNGYQEGRLERTLREAIGNHLKDCQDCREEEENIEEVRIEELLEFFEAPQFAAAQGQDLPHLSSLVWQDEEGKWEAVLYMASSSVDEEVSFSLKVPPGQGGEFSLVVGEKVLSVSERHTEKISREMIRKALEESKGQLKIRFKSKEEDILLFYRGER